MMPENSIATNIELNLFVLKFFKKNKSKPWPEENANELQVS